MAPHPKENPMPTSTRRRKGFGYVRVSRVNGRDGDSFISPEIQRERIEAVAKANGITIVDWFEDYDRSGATNDRPGFQTMLDRIEQCGATLVVVARLSRFARSVAGMHESLQRIRASTNGRGGLVTPEVGDTSTPTGKLLLNVLAALADFELEVARENWTVAQSKAVERGVKIANRPPIGYRFDREHRLTPDAKLGPLVGDLYRRRGAGHSYSELRSWWHEQTGRWLPQQTITRVLKNRVYLGENSYGKLTQKRAHTALVTPAEFDVAQATFAPRPARRNGSLLGGLLTCGSCGRKMTASGSAAKPRYRCTGESFGCKAPATVKRSEADEHVTRLFLEHARQHAAGADGVPKTSGLDEANATLETAQHDLSTYLRLDLASIVDEGEFKAVLAEKQDAVDRARIQVTEANTAEHRSTRYVNVVDAWDSFELEEQKRLLAAGIDRIEVRRPSSRGARVPFCDRAVLAFN
jgi:DNA invertase Pin-like site-specific DNA recombinase